MKKHVFYFVPLCLLTFIACTKGKKPTIPEKKKEVRIEAYKNALQVPVEVQFGYLKSKDTSKKIDYSKEKKIAIAAGKTHEKPGTSIAGVTLVSVKFKFGAKEKIDTLCKSFFAKDKAGLERCKKDTISFFNKARWKSTKSTKGKDVIVKQEYTIDAKDMAEAK